MKLFSSAFLWSVVALLGYANAFARKRSFLAKPTVLFESSSVDNEAKVALLDQNNAGSSSATFGLPPPTEDYTVQLQDNRKGLHLGALIGGTLWWYVYSSADILQNQPEFFFGLPDWAITSCASYVTISQVIVYGILWQLTNAKTLRQGQALITACILCCVPADCLIVLFNPAGSQLATVSAFGLVTMVYGLFLAHYLRLASAREEQKQQQQQQQQQQLDTMPEEQLVQQLAQPAPQSDATHHHALHPEGPVGELKDYRPPKKLQSFHMAISFTRSFVAFTLAVAGFREALLGDEHAGIWLLASCTVVALHTAIEMSLTTVFPGSDLEEYTSFLTFEATVYALHIISSSVIAHESAFGETIWDELLYSWLFGNATANFFDRLRMLFGDVDFDAWFGLSKE